MTQDDWGLNWKPWWTKSLSAFIADLTGQRDGSRSNAAHPSPETVTLPDLR
ncbi:MAG: hypothetical protein WCC37_02640 [Candidatus Sulfotelmatobacter sp.]